MPVWEDWIYHKHPIGRVRVSTDMVQTQDAVLPGMGSFADMLRGADVAEGGDLLKSDAKEGLVGVPFLIYRVTYRDGIKDKSGKVQNYISFDIVTADAATFEKRKAYIPQTCAFGPEERLVFNDGSTGLARQMTAYLHEKGLINVGEVSQEGGPMGESSFDRYRGEWVSPRGKMKADGSESDVEVYCKLYLPRGLRVSDYEAEATGQDARTFYFG